MADRWVRQLEEETGAVRGGRIESGGVATGAEAGPGPSTLSRRNEGLNDDNKRLPEFFLGSYEEALRITQTEAKVLCVVLVSEEHDDVVQFKRLVQSSRHLGTTVTNKSADLLLPTLNSTRL